MELVELLAIIEGLGPALIDVIPVVLGWIGSIAVIKNQIATLEKKVDKHNNVIERVFKLEQIVEDNIHNNEQQH